MQDFTQEQMTAMFTQLVAGQDWKGPICKKIEKAESALAMRAIEFFTGASSYISRDGNFNTYVISQGYRSNEGMI